MSGYIIYMRLPVCEAASCSHMHVITVVLYRNTQSAQTALYCRVTGSVLVSSPAVQRSHSWEVWGRDYVHTQSLKAPALGNSCTFMSGSLEQLKPHIHRPLTYRRAVPGLPESCCVALGQPTTPAAKRERLVGWRSDEVAIAHDRSGPWRQQVKQPWTFISV